MLEVVRPEFLRLEVVSLEETPRLVEVSVVKFRRVVCCLFESVEPLLLPKRFLRSAFAGPPTFDGSEFLRLVDVLFLADVLLVVVRREFLRPVVLLFVVSLNKG